MFFVAFHRETGVSGSFQPPHIELSFPADTMVREMSHFECYETTVMANAICSMAIVSTTTTSPLLSQMEELSKTRLLLRKQLATSRLLRCTATGDYAAEDADSWNLRWRFIVPDVDPSAYARAIRRWPRFSGGRGFRDHVTRCLTERDYRIFERMQPGDQYPEADSSGGSDFLRGSENPAAATRDEGLLGSTQGVCSAL